MRAIRRDSGQIEWEAKTGSDAELFLAGNVLYVRTGGQFTRLKDGGRLSGGLRRDGSRLAQWQGFGVTKAPTRESQTCLA